MRRIAIVGAAVLAAGTTLAAVRAVTPNGWNGKVDTRGTMTDRLHPNPGGYHIWMDAVLPDFKRICGK